ncbi:alpha/beta hydrolase [Streptomyces sp. NPDC058045]|uniref:alpha/beta hydrolase n=1 Tax=Streptomyces sp. NPDC058045 TaxID=3346311 RepID=UPI0036F0D844
MAQRGTRERVARLGRAVAPPEAGVGGAVLLLPSGTEQSARGPSPLAEAALRPLARRLARAGRAEGLAVHLVRYRTRGWNGAQAGPAEDAEWAADEVVRRYGDVPVCLAGTGTGGRAALRAAGHEAVDSVLALAPRLPDEGTAAPPEPVRQLAGRQVLIVHGTNDTRSDPESSFRLAERAKKANRGVCRFEVHADGHGLRQYRAEVALLAVDFVLGTLFGHPMPRPLQDAMAAPPPLGLRMPLAAGYGSTRGTAGRWAGGAG